MRDLEEIHSLAARIHARASTSDPAGVARDLGVLAECVADLAVSLAATDQNQADHTVNYHASQI